MALRPLPRRWPVLPSLVLLAVMLGLGPPRARAAVSLDPVEIVTGGADPDEALPLVVVLHGRGGGVAQLRKELARMPTPVRVIVPRGSVRVEGGRRAWFDERVRHGSSAELAALASSTADELADLIEGVRRRRPTCGEAIVVGWSQGGVLAFVLALRHPELVERSVVVGGSLPDRLVPRRLSEHAPVTALHGTDDRTVPFRHTRSLAKGLRTLGFAVELHPHSGVGHELAGPMRRELRGIVRQEAELAGRRCRVRG